MRGSCHANVFDAVIMVDGVGRREVERIMPEIGKRLEARGLKVDPAETLCMTWFIAWNLPAN